MSAYRLLALDMDGTLLTSDKRISARTLESVRLAARHGIAVALSTGRAVTELFEYRGQMRGSIRYASLLSGGHVYHLDDDRTICTRPFETDVALAIARQGLAEDAMVHVMTTSQSAATHRDVERMDELGQGIYQEMFRRQCTFADDMRDYIRACEGQVCKVNLYHPSQEARARTIEALRGIDAQMAVGEAASVEFTPTGVTKALGLQLLCEHVGCTMAECVAVGDGFNDVEALQAAGLSVAMGNADEQIRRLADVTVADNDHDGIAEVVDLLLR